MKNGFVVFSVLGATACLALVSGCGSGRPEVAPVSGKVTLGGKPVATGTVQFWPEEGRPASGTINEDGTYTLTTFEQGDGAVLGKHTVTVEAMMTASKAPKPKSFEEELAMGKQNNTPIVQVGPSRSLVPRQYATPGSSPLKREVARGENKIDLELNMSGN